MELGGVGFARGMLVDLGDGVVALLGEVPGADGENGGDPRRGTWCGRGE